MRKQLVMSAISGVQLVKWIINSLISLKSKMRREWPSWRSNIRKIWIRSNRPNKFCASSGACTMQGKSRKMQVLSIHLTVEGFLSQELIFKHTWFNQRCAKIPPRKRDKPVIQVHQSLALQPNSERESCLQNVKNSNHYLNVILPKSMLTVSL